MTAYLQSDEWQDLLAELVGSIGDTEFCESLAHACEQVAGYESTLINVFAPDRRPVQAFENLPEEYAEHYSRSSYYSAEYLLDPFYSLYERRAADGVYRLSDVVPEGFFDSDFYAYYYEKTRLADETALFCELSEGRHILIDMANREGAEVNDAKLADLRAVAPVLIALCRKHVRLVGIPGGAASESRTLMGASLDQAFRNFGRDHLSPRECEVIQLILKGHSTKSIARLLDISIDTVKVYNKRFHSKLDICSQAELFSLFLEAISTAPMDSDVDPLSHYWEITSAQGKH